MIDTKEISDGVDVDKIVDDFGKNMKKILKNNITEHEFDRRKLRMSNIGKQDRQLWYSYNGYEGVLSGQILWDTDYIERVVHALVYVLH